LPRPQRRGNGPNSFRGSLRGDEGTSSKNRSQHAKSNGETHSHHYLSKHSALDFWRISPPLAWLRRSNAIFRHRPNFFQGNRPQFEGERRLPVQCVAMSSKNSPWGNRLLALLQRLLPVAILILIAVAIDSGVRARYPEDIWERTTFSPEGKLAEPTMVRLVLPPTPMACRTSHRQSEYSA